MSATVTPRSNLRTALRVIGFVIVFAILGFIFWNSPAFRWLQWQLLVIALVIGTIGGIVLAVHMTRNRKKRAAVMAALAARDAHLAELDAA